VHPTSAIRIATTTLRWSAQMKRPSSVVLGLDSELDVGVDGVAFVSRMEVEASESAVGIDGVSVSHAAVQLQMRSSFVPKGRASLHSRGRSRSSARSASQSSMTERVAAALFGVVTIPSNR